jgi:hypothetical protein
MTLREVSLLSEGRFKPSALGGYERGERAITVERLCVLASLYGMPADRILGDALDRIQPGDRGEVIVDVGALELLPGQEPRLVATLAQEISERRGVHPSQAIALRTGDLEALALASRVSRSELLQRLEPALRSTGD